MTGCCSQQDCEYAASKYIEILHYYIPSLPWALLDLRVQNVVCSANTGFLLNLVELAQHFPAAVNLDLRLFPGAAFATTCKVLHNRACRGLLPIEEFTKIDSAPRWLVRNEHWALNRDKLL